MGRIRIKVSDEIHDKLDAFCDASGADYSGVIEVLVRDYLDDLAEKVADYEEAESEEEAEFEDEEDEEEGEEDVLFPV